MAPVVPAKTGIRNDLIDVGSGASSHGAADLDGLGQLCWIDAIFRRFPAVILQARLAIRRNRRPERNQFPDSIVDRHKDLLFSEV